MMAQQTIKSLFQSAMRNVTAHIQDFSVHPEKDFSRTRKFPADKLPTFLVAQGSSTTRAELLDFFGFDPDAPTSSAFRQQRAKLKPETLKEALDVFNSSLISSGQPMDCAVPGYRCLAADGSATSFYSTSCSVPKISFPKGSLKIWGFQRKGLLTKALPSRLPADSRKRS